MPELFFGRESLTLNASNLGLVGPIPVRMEASLIRTHEPMLECHCGPMFVLEAVTAARALGYLVVFYDKIGRSGYDLAGGRL